MSLLGFQSNQFGAPANGYLFPLPNNVPAGTTAGTPVQFTVSKPGKFTDDQLTANWDHEFRNSRDSVAARFFFSDSEQDIPFGAGGLQASLGAAASGTDLNFPYQLPIHDRLFIVSETHVFSPRLVNDFRFGLVHINNSAINVNPVTVTDAGIDRPTNNLTSSIYKFTFADLGISVRTDAAGEPVADAEQLQLRGQPELGEGRAHVYVWRAVHSGEPQQAVSAGV